MTDIGEYNLLYGTVYSLLLGLMRVPDKRKHVIGTVHVDPYCLVQYCMLQYVCSRHSAV